MQKGKDEDEMLDMTLKAIEICNIADMATEKDHLEQAVDNLMAKKADLDKTEEDMIKEKSRNLARLRGNAGPRTIPSTITTKRRLTVTQDELSPMRI